MSMLGRMSDWMGEPLARPVTREGALAWVVGCLATGVIIAFGLYLLAHDGMIG